MAKTFYPFLVVFEPRCVIRTTDRYTIVWDDDAGYWRGVYTETI